MTLLLLALSPAAQAQVADTFWWLHSFQVARTGPTTLEVVQLATSASGAEARVTYVCEPEADGFVCAVAARARYGTASAGYDAAVVWTDDWLAPRLEGDDLGLQGDDLGLEGDDLGLQGEDLGWTVGDVDGAAAALGDDRFAALIDHGMCRIAGYFAPTQNQRVCGTN